MVFTAIQIRAFFEDADYLGLSARTAQAMAAEGIATPADLAEFDKDGFEAIYRNLRKPARMLQGGPGRGAAGHGRGGGRGAGRGGGAAAAAALAGQVWVEVEPFMVPAKSQMRIYACALAAKYYLDTSRDLDPENMRWDVVQRFHEEWKAILERKKKDDPPTPKLSKGVAVYKWLESFRNHLNSVVGVRNAPLSYVIRDEVAVPAVAPVLVLGEPFSEAGGSVEGEMIARLDHSHALFKSDNGNVFDMVEAALRGTAISPSIAQFRKSRDGRAAYLAVLAQHAGRNVYDKLHREAEDKLQNRKWNGTASITLSQHMDMHRTAWIQLVDCAEHIPVEVPQGRSRVTMLLKSLDTCVDPSVLAAIAAVRQDEVDKRVNFENAVAYLAPVCPVAARQAKKGKVENANVGAAVAGGLGTSNVKPGIGSSGVALRYHTKKEFMKLPKEQKNELSTWNKSNGGKKAVVGGIKNKSGGDDKSAKKFKAALSAFTAEQNKVLQALADTQTATVAAMAASMPIPTSPAARVTIGSASAVLQSTEQLELFKKAEAASLKLQSIVKKGKNDQSKSD